MEEPSNTKEKQSEQSNNISFEFDSSDIFTTDMVFNSREALIEWIKNKGKQHEINIVITRSDSGKGRKARITFACEKSGSHRQVNKTQRKKRILTKKCGCPFSLSGQKSVTNDWILKVVCGFHNHSFAKHINKNSFTRRLTKKESKIPLNVSKCNNMLPIMKEKSKSNASKTRKRGNARQKDRVHKMGECISSDLEIEIIRVNYNTSGYSQSYMNSLPCELKPYIQVIKDVAQDGNCGFRAIAGLLDMGEDNWRQVRKDLINELDHHRNDYKRLYGHCFDNVDDLCRILSCFDSRPSVNHWMIMPDMGHIIASRYNVVLVHLSIQQSFTFLPLRSNPSPTDLHKLITIGFVNNNHFIQVFMHAGCPIPPITKEWFMYHHSCANGWETLYEEQIKAYHNLVRKEVTTQEIINLDSP
ncbi:hypothetical protein CsatB_018814 [Cannabis sativa]